MTRHLHTTPRRAPLTRALSLALVAACALMMSACSTEDIKPGNKGFMFDRTGALALYTGGSGLQTDTILGPGTHYTGFYDEVRDVDCKDAQMREMVDVLTQSDLTVSVDLRITYSADCSSKEQLVMILDQVGAEGTDRAIAPQALYDRYILPIVRESLRNQLASVTIEDVKKVREGLRDGINKDLQKSIKGTNSPVLIKILTVSDIRLPKEIIDKNRQIELARQDAEQEQEKQRAAKSRLERELFEAQQDRKVRRELAEKEKEIAEINAARDKQVAILRAEATLEGKRREAEGIKAVRQEITAQYLDYLKILKEAEVRKATADAMGNGTVWYVGKDFVVPPGTNTNIAVSR